MSPYITSPTSTPTHIAEASSQHVPTTSSLDPNFPNPFNASTQITYRLATPRPGAVWKSTTSWANPCAR